MADDLAVLLREAAPRPQGPADPGGARRRAARIRRRRRATGGLGAALLVAVAVMVLQPLRAEQTLLGPSPSQPSVKVSIFLLDAITTDETAAIGAVLADDPTVVAHHYESRTDAYEHFAERFADDPALLESVDPDMLPAAFHALVIDETAAQALVRRVQPLRGVDHAAIVEDAGLEAGAWHLVRDPDTGISLRRPEFWTVVEPPVVRGRDHVVTVASPGVQRGPLEPCEHDPSAGWPVDGAVVRVYDRGAAGPDAPDRPVRFELGEPTLNNCNFRVRGWQLTFTDQGRELSVVVFVGHHAHPWLKVQAAAVLESVAVR